MRYMTIAGVLVMLAAQAQAESRTYRTVLIPEKSVQACSGWGQTYAVDISNGVLTLGVNYARRLFSEPVTSGGKIQPGEPPINVNTASEATQTAISIHIPTARRVSKHWIMIGGASSVPQRDFFA